MIDYIIGIDGGGTSTKAYALDKDKNVLKNAKTGPSSAAVVSENVVWDNVLTAISNVYINDDNYHCSYIHIGLSAYSILNDVDKYQEIIAKKYNVEVAITSDLVVALYSILKNKYQNGVVVVAGTGVAIYGQNHHQNVMIGGWGHIIRELGSAYACVHHLAINIIDQMENNLPLTTFQSGFLDYLSNKGINGLKPLFYEYSKNDIALCVKYIRECAIKKNQEAITLLKEEGVNLANQVIKAINKLALQNDYVIGLKGGFVQYQSSSIIDAFCETLKKNNINAITVFDEEPPVIGVYYIAKENHKI